jgi:peroxiredoxin
MNAKIDSAAARSTPLDATTTRPAPVGSAAPGFTAYRPDGQPFTFRPDKLTRNTLLIFYRGGWCPACNTHLSELRFAEHELKQKGFDVLFLSGDRPDLLHTARKEPELCYELLSDSGMHAARAFGIAYRVSDEILALSKRHGVDLEEISGEQHHELPVPAVFVIDTGGVIRYVYANPDHSVRLKAAELLAAVQSLSA